MRDQRNEGARAEDLMLCTVRAGGEDRMGAFVDIGTVDRNAALGVDPRRVAMRRWLPVASERDRMIYQSMSDPEGAAA